MDEDKVTDTFYEYSGSITGPLILRQIPQERLADRPAFALRDGASPMEIREAAEWVSDSCPGVQVMYFNDDGFLVKHPLDLSGYESDEDGYYEWVEPPSLLSQDEDGLLEVWGHGMLANYGWEVVAQWKP